MHTDSPSAQLPPLAQHDKDTLLLFLSLGQEPVAASQSARLHYTDLLEWSSRPEIAAYLQHQAALCATLYRNAALACLGDIMRTARDEAVRCRAAIGILRATDPARLKTRAAKGATSPPARTRNTAGAAPPQHPAHQNGHLHTTLDPHEPAAPARTVANEPAAPARPHSTPTTTPNEDPSSPEEPDDTPGPRPGPKPLPDQDPEDTSLNDLHPATPASSAQPHDDINNVDEAGLDLHDEDDEGLDEGWDDEDQDWDDDDEDWNDEGEDEDDWKDDDHFQTHPDPRTPTSDFLRPQAPENPAAPEPIPRTLPHAPTRAAA
jgi:hypothetical protein